MAEAIYFDGVSAHKQRVEVRLGEAALELQANAATLARWPLASLREMDALPGQLRLRSVDAPELANLILSDAGEIAALRSRLPSLPPDAIRHQTSRWKIVGLSLGAVASILVLITVVIPLMADKIAERMPIGFERRLGEAVSVEVKKMFEADVCTSPAGVAALGKLSAALTNASNLRHPVRIDVLKTTSFNAIALPGGQVFLFDGLLQKAQGLDEVAGVLGHEIGHEAGRDSLRGMIRSGGTAFLLGLLFGDVSGSWAVLFVSRQIIDSAHSREAESKADDFGREVMHELGRPAADMARLLVRMSGEEKGKGSLFASHPLSKDRLARLQAADDDQKGQLKGAPLLTPAEWAALKRICNND